MADVVVGDGQKSSKFSNRKLLVLSLSGLTAFIVLSLIIFFWISSLNNAEFKIGNSSIDKHKVDQYTKEIATYYSINSLKPDGKPKQIAKEILLMNAALKDKAHTYNVSYSNSDIDNQMQHEYDSYGGKDNFNSLSKTQGVYNYITMYNENKVLKNKLEKKVLSYKEFLVVSVNVDTPYFNSSKDKLKLIQEAKQKIKKDIFPLVQRGEPYKTIALKTDINNFNDSYDQGDPRPFYSMMLTQADIWKCGDINKCFNDIPGYNVDGAERTSDRLVKLEKVGQYTDVFTSKAGLVGFIRLEKKQGENYNSWEDLIRQYELKYKSKLDKM